MFDRLLLLVHAESANADCANAMEWNAMLAQVSYGLLVDY